jgi:hypothetical protein
VCTRVCVCVGVCALLSCAVFCCPVLCGVVWCCLVLSCVVRVLCGVVWCCAVALFHNQLTLYRVAALRAGGCVSSPKRLLPACFVVVGCGCVVLCGVVLCCLVLCGILLLPCFTTS